MLTTTPESRPATSGNPIAGHRLRADVWLPGDVALMVEMMIRRSSPAPVPELIYLASPYTSADPAVVAKRFNAACVAAGQLMSRGFFVFSPIAHSHPIATAVKLNTGWEFWRDQDFAMLSACSRMIVLTLPGWNQSRGVAAEIEYMQAAAKPVQYMRPGDGFVTDEPSMVDPEPPRVSPAAAAYDKAMLTEQGAAKLTEVMDPASPVGKPTRPSRRALPSAPVSLPANPADEPLVIGKEGSNFHAVIYRRVESLGSRHWRWKALISIGVREKSLAQVYSRETRAKALEYCVEDVREWLAAQHFSDGNCIRAAREVEAMLAAAEGEGK